MWTFWNQGCNKMIILFFWVPENLDQVPGTSENLLGKTWGGRGGGRLVESEGQTGLDTDQQVPALGANLKAAGEATSI